MTQQIRSDTIMNHHIALIEAGDRLAFFREYLKGKRVLHVGCTDFPRFNPANNLHITLNRFELAALHGLDIDRQGIEELSRHVNQPLYSAFDQVTEAYDVVLVPEVLEHTLNAGLFLQQLMKLNTSEILLIAPNAIDMVLHNPGSFGWVSRGGDRLYRETVHSDHCCYYSPMTLAATVRKAIAEYAPDAWAITGLFVTGISVGCVIRRFGSKSAV